MNYVGSILNIYVLPLLIVLVSQRIYRKKKLFSRAMMMKYFMSVAMILYFHTLMYVLLGIDVGSHSWKGTIFSVFFTVVVTAVSELLNHRAIVTYEYVTEKSNGKKIKKPYVALLLWWILFFGIIILIQVIRWSIGVYDVGLTSFIFTVTSPLKGKQSTVVHEAFVACCAPVLCAVIPMLGMIIVDVFTRKEMRVHIRFPKKTFSFNYLSTLRRCGAVFICFVILSTLLYGNKEYDFFAFVAGQFQQTKIYDDYYVDPSDVKITEKEEGKSKNLIYIYVESMENTYADKANGGKQEQNLIPNMTALAKDNISFSNSEKLGGYRSYEGTGWTLGALFSTSAGVPYAFPTGEKLDESFAAGITTLGDILAEKGYTQEFMCGSDANFGSRKAFYEQHGNYYVFDYYTAIEKGYIPEDYYEWWGFEDEHLYEMAKDEITRLANGDAPFNFTMLTVDTHFPKGYTCELCGDEYDSVAENVTACCDKQLGEFINWCKSQDFYEDTVIVVAGDHPRMDTVLVEGTHYENRTMYNCFINVDVDKASLNMTNREWSSMDMLPTVLSAIGYEIEGDRLGLGTNMFSDKQTLAEELGYDKFNGELLKESDFYIENFR